MDTYMKKIPCDMGSNNWINGKELCQMITLAHLSCKKSNYLFSKLHFVIGFF
jgi:hypothetical protein